MTSARETRRGSVHGRPAGRTTLLLGGAIQRTEADPHYSALRTLSRLRARGSRVVLTDRAAHLEAAPELTALADEVHVLDYGDVPGCVAWSWARAAPFDAVLGFREHAAESVAAVAEALALSGNPLTAVRRVRMRDRCRDYLRSHGFRQPWTLLCTRPQQAEALLRATGRVVVKPRCVGAGSVSLVTEADTLPAAFRTAGADGSAPVLVETWVDGVEYRVDGVIVAGRPRVSAVTREPAPEDRRARTSPRTGPARKGSAERETENAVRAEACAALQVLGLRTGQFRLECRKGSRGVVIDEIRVGACPADRPPADGRAHCELYDRWLDDLLAGPAPRPVRRPLPGCPGP